MSPAVLPDEESVRRFVLERVSQNKEFLSVIAVSVQKYASDFTATVYLGQVPTASMRQYIFDLEDELRAQSISCSIVLKSDEKLPFGGRYALGTSKGDFTFRYYRVDPVKDEDMVFAYSLHQNKNTYRFRLSLTGTLASILRNRGSLDENRLLRVYLDEIKMRIETEPFIVDRVREVMFDSRDVGRFER